MKMEMESSIGKYPARRHVIQIGACPTCSHEIRLSGRIVIGTEIACPACGDELQVVQLEPIQLDWLYDFDSENDDDYDW